MAKKHKDPDVERLEKENRELKKTIRQLMGQLKKVNKGYRKVRDEDADYEIENDYVEENKEEKETCPKCYEQTIDERSFTLANGIVKTIKICKECGHRTNAETKKP